MKLRTGAEKYFEQRMKDPSYAEEYAEAKSDPERNTRSVEDNPGSEVSAGAGDV